jgi:hypothetical protein
MGFCTEEEYQEFLRSCPPLRRNARSLGHHPRKVLVFSE